MSSRETLLTEIEHILSDLIANAQKMLQVSSQAGTKQELTSLQERQEALVERLVATDAVLQRDYPTAGMEAAPAAVERIEKGLQAFQGLNEEFLENVGKQAPLIKFEKGQAHRGHHHLATLKSRFQKGSPKKAGGGPTVDPKTNHESS